MKRYENPFSKVVFITFRKILSSPLGPYNPKAHEYITLSFLTHETLDVPVSVTFFNELAFVIRLIATTNTEA